METLNNSTNNLAFHEKVEKVLKREVPLTSIMLLLDLNLGMKEILGQV